MACAVFFFNDTATTEIYTLSLHDALPIYTHTYILTNSVSGAGTVVVGNNYARVVRSVRDRKSTRLNSSHSQISYAVFCLKKKEPKQNTSALLTSSATLRLRVTHAQVRWRP